MPGRKRDSIPSLRHHKPSDRGVVTLSGRDVYLGRWPRDQAEPPPAVRAEYDRVTAANSTDRIARAARLNRANLDAESGSVDRARAECGFQGISSGRILAETTPVLGSRFTVECQIGSVVYTTLWDVATELSQRLTRIFVSVRYKAGSAQLGTGRIPRMRINTCAI